MLTPSMIGSNGPELGGRRPSPPEQTLLMAERNAWREVHELMHGGMYLKEALDKVQNNSLFWMREVMNESSPNKQKGNPRKARTRRAHGGTPSANLNGRRKERAKETKEAKEKGRQSLNPQTGHRIGLSRIQTLFPFAVITSSRRPAKASVDVPTIVQLGL